MITKTFWGWFWFVVVLTLATTDLSGKVPRMGAVSENARMTVSVYNEAGVPVDVLRRGEQEASRIFYRAGIAVHWLNCNLPAPAEEISRTCREVVFPEHLHLRIVPKSIGLKAEAMGISFQADDGSGCYADLFYEPMEELQTSDGADLASLLGHVAAHEIGHLLLGTNSHAAAGIMQAHWTSQELTDGAAVNRMVFLKEESQRMKQRLLTAARVSRENSMDDAPYAGD